MTGPKTWEVALRVAYFPVYAVFYAVNVALSVLIAVTFFFLLEPGFGARMLRTTVKSVKEGGLWAWRR